MNIQHLFLGLLFLLLSPYAHSFESLFAKIQIPNECVESYKAGYDIFSKTLTRDISPAEKQKMYDEEQTQFAEDCQYAYVLGLFDGRDLFTQRVLLEYGLELEYLRSQSPNLTANQKNIIKNQFKEHFVKRLELAGVEKEILLELDPDSEFFLSGLNRFKRTLKEVAVEEGKAVTFERFIFTSGSNRVYTSYDYDIDENGLKFATDGTTLTLVQGSYQKAGEKIWKDALALVEEYMAWDPGIFWGEDSFLKGAFYRGDMGLFDSVVQGQKEMWGDLFGISVERNYIENKNIREVKEEYYTNQMAQYIQYARELNLNTDPFYEIYQHLLDKQRAFLDRDLRWIKGAQIGAFTAPLVPLAIYVFVKGGIAILGTTIAETGTVVMPMGLTSTAVLGNAMSWKLVGGSVGLLHNLGAALALSPMAYFAYRGLDSYLEEINETGENFSFAKAGDRILAATVSSFPLAVALPVAVAGTAHFGQTMFLSARWLISGGLNIGRNIAANGFLQVLRSGLSAAYPPRVIRLIIASYRSRPILKIDLAADLASTVFAEMFTREYFVSQGWASEDSRFWVRDENGNITINQQSIFTIGTSIAMNVLTKPVRLIKDLGGRFVVERFIALNTGMLVSLGITTYNKIKGRDISQKENWGRRIVFDQSWFSTIGNLQREVERGISFSNFVENRSGRSGALMQFTLLTLLKLSLSLPKTPLKNTIMDAYVKDKTETFDQIRDIFRVDHNLDMSDFSDEDFILALDKIREDVARNSFFISPN